MPRDPSGNYTLPTGNPVVSGATIEADWANTTLADIGQELTNSVSRNGEGGLLAPLELVDGTVGVPALTFSAETTTGLFRSAADALNVVANGNNLVRFTDTNQLEVFRDGNWKRIYNGLTVSNTPPATPAVGELWWDNETGKSYVYYQNADLARSQWVQVDAVEATDGSTVFNFPDPATPTYNAPNGVTYTWDATKTRWDNPYASVTSLPAASITYNNATSGLTATDAQAAIDEIVGSGVPTSAAVVSYDNATSGLTATNVQAALDEIDGTLDAVPADIVSAVAGLQTYKNLFINGSMDIWQRGLGAVTATGYSADRWWGQLGSATGSFSGLAFGVGTTDGFSNPTYFQRCNITTASAVNEFATLGQKIETVQKLSGRTVTLSFWARANTQPLNLGIEGFQYFGTGGTPSANVADIGSTVKVMSVAGWNYYTHTITFPSISGKTLGTDGNDYSMIRFWFSAGTNYSAAGYYTGYQTGIFDFTTLQLEFGDTATEYERRPVAQELELCQRYYSRINAGVVNNPFNTMTAVSTAQAYGVINYKKAMRSTASTVTVSNSFSTFNIQGVGGAQLPTAIAFAVGSPDSIRMQLTGTYTAGQSYWTLFTTANDWIAFDAEL